jgi:hypothetical protein
VQAGTVVREAFELYAAHWRHLVSVAFVVYLAVAALTLALAFVIGVFAAFVTLAGVFWLQGVLVKAVEDVRDGRADLSIRATLQSARPRIDVLSAAGFLAVLGVTAGFALLVVPGLVLLTFWSMIVPAVVLERAGVFRAFRRSSQLVLDLVANAVFAPYVAVAWTLMYLGLRDLGSTP